MNNTSKILGSLLVVALVYIVFLQGCGGKRQVETEVVTVIRVDSSTYIDTIRFDTTTFKYVTVNIPQPYYDTVRIPMPAGNYFDDFDDDTDFIFQYASIYEDTIKKNDSIQLYYRAKVRGYLDELTLGYKIFTPFYIEKTTLIETEVVKNKRFQGFYIGMDVGGNMQSFNHLAPMLELSTQRYNYNAGFNLMNKSVIVGMRVKIGKKIR